MTKTTRQLHLDDNLNVLRALPDASVDAIATDAPYGSGQTRSGPAGSYDDAPEWNAEAERHFHEMMARGDRVAVMLDALRTLYGEDTALAYVAALAVRIVEWHRILPPTGNVAVQCDTRNEHLVRLVLEAVFGSENFRSSIAWPRTRAAKTGRRCGRSHDRILWFSKTGAYTWNPPQRELAGATLDQYRHEDERGRYRLVPLTRPGVNKGPGGQPWRGYDPTRKGHNWSIIKTPQAVYADEPSFAGFDALDMHARLDVLNAAGLLVYATRPNDRSFPQLKRYLAKGVGTAADDVWDDIEPLASQSSERTGWPDQKPRALYERIIAMLTNPGDVVLDPYAASGTTLDAAEQLGRSWIGCELEPKGVAVIRTRLRQRYALNVPVIHGHKLLEAAE